MKPLIPLVIFTVLAVSSLGHTQMAKRINDIASKALEEVNLVRKKGIVQLYGVQTNGPDTQGGDLACAKVTTIVLRKAGAVNEISLGVRNVEEALSRWEKITEEEDVLPGDVIFWVNRFKQRKDQKCTGGGNCHVGIVTEKGYFHNSPLTNAPTFNGISLWAFKFKYAVRPPD